MSIKGLKLVLLYNGNPKSLIPLACSANTKETYEVCQVWILFNIRIIIGKSVVNLSLHPRNLNYKKDFTKISAFHVLEVTK